VFAGFETKYYNAFADLWYWEPSDYDGDSVYSNAYEDMVEAIYAAEISHDAGGWE
jgi:hypothetical protein